MTVSPHPTDPHGSDPDGTEPGWGAARERTVVWYDPMTTAEAGLSMSGIDFLRAIRERKLPPPPIAALFGFVMREIEVGRVVFECVPEESAYNPIGVVHGGLVCTLADTVTACAVQTTLDVGVGYTSIDLSVSYLRPVTTGSGRLRATGSVTKPGRRAAFAQAQIVDADANLVATATSSCLIIDRR